MKRFAWAFVLVPLLAAGGAFAWYRATHRPPRVEYRTTPAGKRKLVGRVTATGTLSATVTVQVGTQISGRIQKLFADWNSPVKKGELVAKIDPLLFEAAVEQASANYLSAQAALAKAKAQALDADRQFKRAKALGAEGLASQTDIDTAETNATVAAAQIDVAKAGLAQAGASLNQAKVNLSYTSIYSPIDGTVISRSVDVGQTVAASMTAPILFTIAEDLRKMQVNTNVAEGDVGRLEAGMDAYFTVDAFPTDRFRGKLSQIRNAAQTVSNVVTYDAVLDVANGDLRLRPGMTANVTLIYSEKDDALAVPNTALRFHPPPEAQLSEGAAPPAAVPPGDPSATRAASPEGASAPSAAPSLVAANPGGGGGGGGGGHRNRGRLADTALTTEKVLYLLRDGKPVPVSLHPGLTDGTYTEVASGDVHPGDAVIVDATVRGSSSSNGSTVSAAAPGAAAAAPMRRLF